MFAPFFGFWLTAPFGQHYYYISRQRFYKSLRQLFLTFFLRLFQVVDTQQLVSSKSYSADTALAYIRYTRARARKAASGGRLFATHDTFISYLARNAQYSTALPCVKSRQIVKNQLVFPNCTLIASCRNRKVLPYPYT